MLVIVGLGNPGDEYKRTRHNAGFMFLDQLKTELEKTEGSLEWSKEVKFEAEHLSLKILNKADGSGSDNIHLLKPLTYMNLAGLSVIRFLNWYKFVPEAEIVLVYDDLDLEIGQYKIQKDVTPKSHNGVNSVVEHIGKDFLNVRLGVDSRKGNRTIPGSDYVLQDMTEDDLVSLNRAISSAIMDLKEVYKVYFQK